MKIIRSAICFAFLITSFDMNAQIKFEYVNTILDYPGASPIKKTIVDANDNLFVTGHFSGTLDLDPLTPAGTIVSGGSADVFLVKYDSVGTFLWGFNFGGPSLEYANDIAVDSYGNVYLAGYYNASIDFDPTAGTASEISGGSSDLFIVKYDPSGNYLTHLVLAGPSADFIFSMEIDLADNIYISGGFTSTLDADPSAGVYTLTGDAAKFNCFVIKYSPSFNFLWAQTFGGPSGDDVAEFLTLDNSGHVYLSGSFESTCDFDPGPGNFYLTCTGPKDIYISKFDTTGNWIWALRFGSTDNDFGCSLETDKDDNVYVFGTIAGSTDFDPSAASAILTPPSSATDLCIASYDATGNYRWAHLIGSTDYDNPGGMDVDSSGNVYLSGYFDNTTDFDPTASVDAISPVAGSEDIFLSRYDKNGNYYWTRTIASGAPDYSLSVQIDKKNNLYVGGRLSDSADVNFSLKEHYVGGFSGTKKIFLAKYNLGLCGSLLYNIDSISNVQCFIPGYASVFASGGSQPYEYAWDAPAVSVNDSSANFNGYGIYSVHISDEANCEIERSFLINGPPSITGFDLNQTFFATGLRPGLPGYIYVTALNERCDPVTGSLTLILDTLTDFASAIPPPDNISGDTLTWNFTDLSFDSSFLSYYITVNTSLTANIGDTAHFVTRTTPQGGDMDSSNNDGNYTSPIVNSFDPNEKLVYPAGLGITGRILNNQTMKYTVGFQNTGTADAINIYILDTLDSYLDTSTLRILTSSHTMYTEYLPGNILKFKFDNIYLPDSNTNEPASHGYVTYEIDQLPNLPHGTQINNTGYIYFDFNSAIVTNTVLNTIDLSLNGIHENFTSIINNSIYPNPTTGLFTVEVKASSQIIITDALGQLILTKMSTDPKETFDLQKNTSGIYFVTIISQDKHEVLKLIKID